MKITKRQLKRIIKEEGYYHKLPEWRVDGHPWAGSLEDLAHEQGRTWGHGAVVNPKEYKGYIKKAKNLAVGNDSTPLRTSKKKLREMIREIVKEYYEN